MSRLNWLLAASAVGLPTSVGSGFQIGTRLSFFIREGNMKNVVVAGGSGLVGSKLLKLILNEEKITVTSLVRAKKEDMSQIRYNEVLFKFDDIKEYKKIGSEIPCDIFFCCLGTTIKKAKTAENFLKVDKDYPIKFMEHLKVNSPTALFVLVSSVGANHPRGLYLTAKYDVENALMKSGLSYIIVRPSLLLGRRNEFRVTERMAEIIANPVFQGMKKIKLTKVLGLDKYSPVQGEDVAKCMLSHALNYKENKVLEGELIRELKNSLT